jgi:hypothetical protein
MELSKENSSRRQRSCGLQARHEGKAIKLGWNLLILQRPAVSQIACRGVRRNAEIATRLIVISYVLFRRLGFPWVNFNSSFMPRKRARFARQESAADMKNLEMAVRVNCTERPVRCPQEAVSPVKGAVVVDEQFHTKKGDGEASAPGSM